MESAIIANSNGGDSIDPEHLDMNRVFAEIQSIIETMPGASCTPQSDAAVLPGEALPSGLMTASLAGME